MKLSEHVTVEEFIYSPTAIDRGIDNSMDPASMRFAVDLCQSVFEPIRKHFNRPIKVNSGFRSMALNRAVNGSKTSQHCKGQAIDLNITSKDDFEWIKENIEFDQLICEKPDSKGNPTWVHISFNRGRNRNQVLKYVRVNGKWVYLPY
jgi:hypothetical protein